MSTPRILRLMRRNVRVNTDPGNMIILIGIPAMYLVFFGLGFQSIASAEGPVYLSFLTPGIMAFQAVMAGIVGGGMLWADKRFGMLAQLLVGPFSRLEYFLGIIFTTVVFGLMGALVMLAGAYAMMGSLPITMSGMLIMLGVITLGSVCFGGLMLLISAFIKSNNAYSGIQVLIVFIVNFASTVFYPLSEKIPLILRTLFLANPLTYVVDIVRDGYFGTLVTVDAYKLIVLSLATIVILGLATRAYARSGVSFG